eukprot:5854199-Alexandrium_andersonii.AAC.1
MSASLVGSEMCIRDRSGAAVGLGWQHLNPLLGQQRGQSSGLPLSLVAIALALAQAQAQLRLRLGLALGLGLRLG